MGRNDFVIALAVEDQYFLSRLLLGVPSPEVDPVQVARLAAEGLIERSGKRWKLTDLGRTYLGDKSRPMDRSWQLAIGGSRA